jgi:hypothetical protein
MPTFIVKLLAYLCISERIMDVVVFKNRQGTSLIMLDITQLIVCKMSRRIMEFYINHRIPIRNVLPSKGTRGKGSITE